MKFQLSTTVRHSLLLAIFGALFFVPGLGGVHLFDWDEVNFAEISREMMALKDYFRIYVNFEPFWEKPPFFFWLQAAAMKGFGVGEFAARLPNALCGIATLVVLYQIGRRLYSPRFGLLWAGSYFGSILPFLYFKSGIIDPWFNLFIFLGLYFFLLFYWKKEGVPSIALSRSKWTYLFWGGFFVGMAILTKGQVAYLLVCLTLFAYWLYQRLRLYVSVPQFLFFTLAATLVTLAWYGLETWKHGPWFIVEFNKYQYRLFSTPDAGHRGFPGYHFLVLLVGCFPASIFALRAFFHRPGGEEAPHRRDFHRWMVYLFWVVLILFTLVKSKIVHYSSMCYFPLTFLAARTIEQLWRGEIRFGPWLKAGLWLIGSSYAAALLAIPWLMRDPSWLQSRLRDPFAQGNLEAAVEWTGWEMLPGIFLLLLLGTTIWLLQRQRHQIAWPTLFGGIGVFILLTLYFYVGRIEAYSQRAAVEFFAEKAGEDAHYLTYGYKSYVHLFYGRTTETQDKHRLLQGPIDKPVYISTKVHKAAELEALPGMQRIGERNGFVFFRRDPE